MLLRSLVLTVFKKMKGVSFRQTENALFEAVCRHDAGGIVGKWARGGYESNGVSTSWVKIKNPTYS